jgi:hypothetical protein
VPEIYLQEEWRRVPFFFTFLCMSVHGREEWGGDGGVDSSDPDLLP